MRARRGREGEVEGWNLCERRWIFFSFLCFLHFHLVAVSQVYKPLPPPSNFNIFCRDWKIRSSSTRITKYEKTAIERDMCPALTHLYHLPVLPWFLNVLVTTNSSLVGIFLVMGCWTNRGEGGWISSKFIAIRYLAGRGLISHPLFENLVVFKEKQEKGS